jgi:hypothetical protein
MTTELEKNGEGSHKPQSESFLEPRTIPKNWDVSAFVSHLAQSRNENIEQPAESTNPVETNTVEDSGSDSVFDPFPQPRTIPGNWDVSEMVSGS